MKYILLIGVLINFSFLNAQDLKQYIPFSSKVVGSIHGKNILESITVQELDNSVIGKEILDKISGKFHTPISSFDDLGIETKATTYIYYDANDSLSYTTMLVPLRSTGFLDTFSQTDEEKVVDKGSYKMISLGNSTFAAWDKSKLAFVFGYHNYNYFIDYEFSEEIIELAAAESEREVFTDGIYETEADTAETIIIDSNEEVEVPSVSPPMVEETVEDDSYYIPYFQSTKLQHYVNNYASFAEYFQEIASTDYSSDLDYFREEAEYLRGLASEVSSISQRDSIYLDRFMNKWEDSLKEAVKGFSKKEVRDEVLELVKSATFYSGNFSVVEDYFEVEDDEESYIYRDYYYEKKVLEARWTESKLDEIMRPSKHSIIHNKNYMDQLDAKAAGNVWNNNFTSLATGMYSSIFSSYGMALQSQDHDWMGSENLSANLYLEKTQARINVEMDFNEEMGKSYKRMSDQKINKKFFKYINEDNLLGYMSYNVNTKNTLEEYPKLMSKVYNSILGGHKKDETELVSDLFSLLLDEKAVSKVIKGDALFVFTNLAEREVTYTSYEYNEDYEYEPVEKTKTELLPDFLFMASTEDTKLVDKLIAYLVKNNVLEQRNGFYEIKEMLPSMPLGLYFTIKDGIFFLSTSDMDMSQIVNNDFKKNLSGKHKKIMKQGNYSAFFDGAKFGKKFPLSDTWGTKQLRQANFAIGNASNFYLKSSRIKRNKVNGEIVMEIPYGHKNSLTYMLNFIDHFANQQ